MQLFGSSPLLSPLESSQWLFPLPAVCSVRLLAVSCPQPFVLQLPLCGWEEWPAVTVRDKTEGAGSSKVACFRSLLVSLSLAGKRKCKLQGKHHCRCLEFSTSDVLNVWKFVKALNKANGGGNWRPGHNRVFVTRCFREIWVILRRGLKDPGVMEPFLAPCSLWCPSAQNTVNKKRAVKKDTSSLIFFLKNSVTL